MLVRLDIDLGFLFIVIEVHRRDLGRLESLDNEDLDRFVPANDVDLLAKQFIDDVLDSRSANSNTGTHAIDVGVVGRYSNLGAVTGLPGDLFNLDHVVLDLGDLECKELADKLFICPGKSDLDAVGALLKIFHQRLDSLSDTKSFTRSLFASWQESFDSSEADDQVGAFVALHDTGDQLPYFIFVFFEDPVPFRFPDFLKKNLFARHGSEATEIFCIDLLAVFGDCRFTGFPVNYDSGGFRFAELFAHGRKQCSLDALEDDFFLDFFRAMDRVYKSEDLFGFHRIRPFSGKCFLCWESSPSTGSGLPGKKSECQLFAAQRADCSICVRKSRMF